MPKKSVPALLKEVWSRYRKETAGWSKIKDIFTLAFVGILLSHPTRTPHPFLWAFLVPVLFPATCPFLYIFIYLIFESDHSIFLLKHLLIMISTSRKVLKTACISQVVFPDCSPGLSSS